MLQYPRLMICLQIIDSMDISLSKLQETGKDREAWCAAVHGITESHDRVTERQKDGVTCRQCNDSHPLPTYLQKNIYSREFPSDTVNKNLPATAEEQVWSLVWEDSTCLRATKLIHHNYWNCAPQSRVTPAHLLQREKARTATTKTQDNEEKKNSKYVLSRLPVLLLSALFLKRLPTVLIHTHQVFLLPWGKYCYCLFVPVTPNSSQPHELKPTRLLCPWNFPGKNTGGGCHFLLQGIFLKTQGSNLCLLHWQAGSLPLSHQGSLGKNRGA